MEDQRCRKFAKADISFEKEKIDFGENVHASHPISFDLLHFRSLRHFHEKPKVFFFRKINKNCRNEPINTGTYIFKNTSFKNPWSMVASKAVRKWSKSAINT